MTLIKTLIRYVFLNKYYRNVPVVKGIFFGYLQNAQTLDMI